MFDQAYFDELPFDWILPSPPPPIITRLLHVRHPALLTVVHKRGEVIIRGYDTLSSLDDEYLTGQVGLDVADGDVIEVTTLAGLAYRYQV